MPQQGKLEDDVAVITGSGRNIGEKIAKTFAKEGAKIVVVDLDESRAKSTVKDIKKEGCEAIPVKANITNEAQVKSIFKKTKEEFGGVDILVNNAAITDRVGLLELSAERFDEIMSVNLRGTFLCTREAAKSMKSSDGGRIVNIASTSAHTGRENAVAYATSKSGILNFTRSAAVALADYDIRVNTLSPTRTGSRLGMEDPRDSEVPDDILTGRWGEPQDQANAALYLVSEESSFVNGTELVVDGGSLAVRQ